MKESESKGRLRIIVRSLSFLVSMLTVTVMLACIAAVPLVVMYAKSDKGYVSTVEVPAPADKVYETAIREIEARPHLKILKRDDAEQFIEITDEVQKASVKATPISPDKTELVVVAQVPKTEEGKEVKREREAELSLRVVNVLCDALGVKCNVVEK
jgi:ABC-type Na+ efflux pump permease subunit